jgi:hypothetical protein
MIKDLGGKARSKMGEGVGEVAPILGDCRSDESKIKKWDDQP